MVVVMAAVIVTEVKQWCMTMSRVICEGSNYWWLGMDVVLGTMTGFWDQRASGTTL